MPLFCYQINFRGLLLLLLIIIICTGLLLAYIFGATMSHSFLHVRFWNWNVVLLAVSQSFLLSLWLGRESWLTLGHTAQQYNDFVAGAIGFTSPTNSFNYTPVSPSTISYSIMNMMRNSPKDKRILNWLFPELFAKTPIKSAKIRSQKVLFGFIKRHSLVLS
jgi:hypothetical protein